MGTGEMTCERDRSPTRLTCIKCATPICPRCFVRTPVGLKCEVCGANQANQANQAKEGGGEVPARRARWIAPLVIGVVLLAVLGLPRLLSGSSDSSDPDNGESPILDDAPRITAPEGRARFGSVGQEVRDENLGFVVSAFGCGPTEIPTPNGVRIAQGRFCLLTVTVSNFGRSPVPFLGPAQALLDGQNRTYGPDERATQAHPVNAGRDPTSALINPSNELQAVLVFDVPPEVEPQLANLRANPGGPGALVRLRPPG
ncbi:MAG: DUF4352 domain-containing protein [Actinobacteria bacterium]|nr:DUF4352 domain-containing protein [Actinomycetota bacterium]